MVLTGDSHARQWLPGLDAVGQAGGWRVIAWTKSACTVIDIVTYNPSLEQRYEGCENWRAVLFDEITALD
ncbi:MAG: hypothetical protein GWP48_16615 [Actinobacteria bacterium]|nr:hypothetical protein [Actinomycetota bacterium]